MATLLLCREQPEGRRGKNGGEMINGDGFVESGEGEVNAEEFTQAVAEEIQARLPKAQVQIEGLLAISVSVRGHEGQFTCYLDNAWARCSSYPEDQRAILDEYIESYVAIAEKSGQGDRQMDANAVIPILKSEEYLAAQPLQII